MPHCSKCGIWISALVYECPACGTKPKGPPPVGLIPSDIATTSPRTPARRPLAPPPQAQAPRQQPKASPPLGAPFQKAPGPSEQEPQPFSAGPAQRPVRRPVVRPERREPEPAAPSPGEQPAPDEPDEQDGIDPSV